MITESGTEAERLHSVAVASVYSDICCNDTVVPMIYVGTIRGMSMQETDKSNTEHVVERKVDRNKGQNVSGVRQPAPPVFALYNQNSIRNDIYMQREVSVVQFKLYQFYNVKKFCSIF